MAGNWGDNKVRELLTLRAEAEINKHFSGTVKDGPLLERLAKSLNERGYTRDKTQVTTKLKSLRRRFHQVNDNNSRSGRGRLDWPYFDLCQTIWGTSHSANPVNLVSSIEAGEEEGKPPAPTCSSSSSSSSRATEEASGSENTACEDGDSFHDKPGCPPLSKKKRKLTKPQVIGREIKDLLLELDREDEARERLRRDEQRAYEADLRREEREIQRQEREASRRDLSAHMDMFGVLVQEMQNQSSFLREFMAQNGAPQTQTQTQSRQYPAPAPQRRFCPPRTQYHNRTVEDYDSFDPSASSSFLLQLD